MAKKLPFYLIICIVIIILISCNKSRITSDDWIHISSKGEDIPAPGPSNQQTACLILDVDKNSLNDFIIGSRKKRPALLWYQRHPEGWTKYIIEDSTLPIEAGGTFFDIDGDGDDDIVFGGDSSSNKVWWWENPYPYYDRSISWTRREIKPKLCSWIKESIDKKEINS